MLDNRIICLVECTLATVVPVVYYSNRPLVNISILSACISCHLCVCLLIVSLGHMTLLDYMMYN